MLARLGSGSGRQPSKRRALRVRALLLSSKKPGVCRAFCLLLLMLFDRAASSLLSLHCGVSLC
jgi:hypothetical protein